MEQGIKSHEEEIMEPRRPEEAKETKSSSTRSNDVGLKTHQKITCFKKNDRAINQLARPDLETVHKPSPEALTEPWKLPLGELARPNHIRLVIHQKTTYFEEFDQEKSTPVRVGLGVAQLALTEDIYAIQGGVRPNLKELCQEPTYSGNTTHQRHTSSWNQTKINFGLEVIQFLNQWFPGLPYLESHEFGQHQTYLWRPGDLNTDLEASLKVLQCSNTQRIRRILSHFHFPYPKPSLPYLPCLEPKEINQQRLFLSSLVCILKSYTMNLDVPRHHQFAPKLSRLKAPHNLPYLARLLHKFTNGHIHLFCTIFFHFLSI